MNLKLCSFSTRDSYKQLSRIVNKINKSEVLALSNLGIDYFEPNKGLDNLVEIAAKVSGMNVSMINLIDS